MSSINPRKLAVMALCRVDTDGAYSNIVLNSYFKEFEIEQKDKSLCTSIFYGSLDRKITIDYILKLYIKSGFNKIKPFTLNVLRTAVYQIMYMDKIPESAAVNEAVNLIKKSKESYGSGFVNGVLRNILREKPTLPTGDTPTDISIRYSTPKWIVESLIQDYSLATAKNYLESTLLPPLTYIKVNTQKCSKNEIIHALSELGIEVLETDLNDGLVIADYSSIESLKLYKNGMFFVQDLACQLAISSLQIADNDRIFDMCSAPGGKAFTASLSANNVSVLAADLYEQRVGLIDKGAKRLGLTNVSAHVLDATVYNSKIGLFDKVICDVPCSGLGVLRRKPEIKYHSDNDFDELRGIQLAILNNADNYLKSGGKILYSTCTLRKAENEEIVTEFLKEHSNYKLLVQKTYFPHIDKTDGFYSAVLIKN